MFCSYFGRNDDSKNSFWNLLTFKILYFSWSGISCISHWYIFNLYSPLIDEDEDDEFQKFLDDIDEEDDDDDQEPNVDQFIRNDKFIQDYGSNDTISSFCRDLSKVSKPLKNAN